MKKTLLLSVGLLFNVACATQQVSSTNPAAAVAPQLSVERFLQASNSRDFVAMSRIFGTSDGAIGETGGSFGCFWKKIGSAFGGQSCQKWSDVELRLDAIAEVLLHTDYEVVSQQRVAGRSATTTRIGVDMVLIQNRQARDIGFFVVLADGRYMLQCIELDKVLSGSHNGDCRRG